MPQLPDFMISPTAFDYIFHHLFLPPKLPHADDDDAHHEATLLRIVVKKLQGFREAIRHEDVDGIKPVVDMIMRVQEVS